jgi:hypothetical protein
VRAHEEIIFVSLNCLWYWHERYVQKLLLFETSSALRARQKFKYFFNAIDLFLFITTVLFYLTYDVSSSHNSHKSQSKAKNENHVGIRVS